MLAIANGAPALAQEFPVVSYTLSNGMRIAQGIMVGDARYPRMNIGAAERSCAINSVALL